MFGLELFAADQGEVLPPFLAGRCRLLATARSAFALLHRTLSPHRVWLPSYLGGSVLPAFERPETDLRFYAIDESLRVANGRWLVDVGQGDAVVFVDYFGFNRWEEWGRQASERGAWVIEDACQALLNRSFSRHAHYVILSPRKFVGVPDGGVLIAQGSAALPADPLPPAPPEWWCEALAASVRRADYDLGSGDEGRSWFAMFQKVERTGPVTPSAMSELSAFLLRRGIDWNAVALRRQANYRMLAEALGEFALFPELEDSVVPLGFPVRLANRDPVRFHLFSRQIFPPVHWPLEGIVPEAFAGSHLLAREILTLPCDQRYDQDVVTSLIRAVREVGPRPVRTKADKAP